MIDDIEEDTDRTKEDSRFGTNPFRKYLIHG